jgi:anti-sigma regulatory factor (Ser/Thr protein kinase)
MSLARVNTAEIVIANAFPETGRVTSLLAELAREHGLPAAATADMSVALDEVLSNIIKYGYADTNRHEITIRFIVSARELTAEVEDDGRAFDPLSAPPPDLHKPLAERKIGGLGIHFLRTLLTEVSYCRAGDHNRLVLKKSLAQ